MTTKENKFIYENIIRDEDFHSSLSRDEYKILELCYGQDLSLEVAAKMMDITPEEVEAAINKVFHMYRDNIRNLDFLKTRLSPEEIEKKVGYYGQKALKYSNGSSKLDRVMAAIYDNASKAGEEALMPYKKESSLPILLEARLNEYYFDKLVNLIEDVEEIT